MRGRLVGWVVILSGCALMSAACASDREAQGPLYQPGKIAYVITAKPGRVITDGSVVLDVRGREDATIVRVTSVGNERNLEFLGAKLVGPHRRYTSTQWAPGWPPEHFKASSVVDPAGATVQPSFRTWKKQAYELLLGYRVRRAAFGVRSGVTVTYRVGGQQYETTIASIIVTCPPHAGQTKCLLQGFHSVTPATSG